ncbi:ABC transporter ATP-binding protein [Paraburkholderia tropica]|uniref:ABC transporter ATP-binding protein n=1 Tax=Paraburkholderia tropica TaxID=92647 RepID=UPI00301A1BD8
MKGVVLNNVRKSFGAGPNAGKAINGLDLVVPEGEFFVLLGPSGCGKTTTLRCVAGLESPDAGTISIGDEVVVDSGSGVLVPTHRRDIGMVFQSYALWPHMTVAENVAYPVRARRRPAKAALAEQVGYALQLVGLSALAQRYPAELSGGQQQRVALARALAASPRLVLFDEPLSNLDAQLRIQLRDELRRLHDRTGHTSIYVTHDQSEALALADKVAVMNRGRLEQLGPPEAIFQHPASEFVARFVGFENYLDADLVGGNGGFAVHPRGWPQPLATAVHGEMPGPVRVAFRSSSLEVVPAEGALGTAGQLGGLLSSVTYQGDRYLATVDVFGCSLTGILNQERWPWGVPAGTAAAGTSVVLLVRAGGLMMFRTDSVTA